MRFHPSGLPLKSHACTRPSSSPMGTIATVTPCSAQLTRTDACSSKEPCAPDVEMTPTSHGQTIVYPAGPAAFRALVRVLHVRTHRDDDDLSSRRISFDTRSAGHDVRGQTEHVFERAGCYGGHGRSLVLRFCVLAEANLAGECPSCSLWHTVDSKFIALPATGLGNVADTGEECD